MRAKESSDLLEAGDRVAVSNITGREASAVTAASQKYCRNIVGGWALGKGEQNLEMPGLEPVPVFPNVQELSQRLQRDRLPNKFAPGTKRAGGDPPASRLALRTAERKV